MLFSLFKCIMSLAEKNSNIDTSSNGVYYCSISKRKQLYDLIIMQDLLLQLTVYVSHCVSFIFTYSYEGKTR